MNAALAITAALEAIEAGDVDLCTSILLGAGEDGPSDRRALCAACGQSFQWPGERDAHIARVHGFEEAAA
jgi:hypothetical protein